MLYTLKKSGDTLEKFSLKLPQREKGYGDKVSRSASTKTL